MDKKFRCNRNQNIILISPKIGTGKTHLYPECVVEGLEDVANNNFASKSEFISGDYDE